MKRTVLASLAGLAVATIALTGCGTSSSVRGESAPPVSFAAMGPVASAGSSDTYFFGAGDALGQQIFTVYVASLESDQHYATGANDFPSE